MFGQNGNEQDSPEFSRRVRADSISHRPFETRIEASRTEREALAKRFGLQSLESLAATLTLRQIRGEMIEVDGAFAADVVQTCVVTLEPVSNRIEDRFTAIFAPPQLISDHAAKEIELDVDAEDPPEPIIGGAIDLGELTAQYLSLALDPYPRCPEANVQEMLDSGSGQIAESSPFAALSKLRRDA